MTDAVLLAGATGLVGREILALLLADAGIARVHTLGRRPPVVADQDAQEGAQRDVHREGAHGRAHQGVEGDAQRDVQGVAQRDVQRAVQGAVQADAHSLDASGRARGHQQAHARPTRTQLTHHASDLQHIPALPPVQTVYIALGTTIKVAGSQQAFRAVDHDAVLAVARAAQAAGATRLGLVSAMGADAASRFFYNRVKGEVEHAVAQMGFATLVIARPSLLVGDRGPLGQPIRPGEVIGEAIGRWLRPLIPAHYRPIHAGDVARALVAGVARGAVGRQVLLSGQMQPG